MSAEGKDDTRGGRPTTPPPPPIPVTLPPRPAGQDPPPSPPRSPPPHRPGGLLSLGGGLRVVQAAAKMKGLLRKSRRGGGGGAPRMSRKEARDRIGVSVRCRPMNHKELSELDTTAWCVDEAAGTVVATADSPGGRGGGDGRSGSVGSVGSVGGSSKAAPSTFDHCFGPGSTNADVYSAVADSIVETALGGYNGTIFAYGQTASGKTHTLMGSDADPGIIPRSISAVFRDLKSSESERLVRVSYIEIYNDVLRDLFNTEKLSLHQKPRDLTIMDDRNTGPFVKGLTEVVVVSTEHALALLARGETNRHYGATKMNQKSSRSHVLWRMMLETKTVARGRGSADSSSNCSDMDSCSDSALSPVRSSSASSIAEVQVSCLNLVDLAGSERQKKAVTTGQRQKEGAQINKSLHVLSNVIFKLGEGEDIRLGGHVNFRDSKLTRLLSASLGGNAKTAIVTTISPASSNVSETTSTLQFASRAKKVVNKAKKNLVDADSSLINHYRSEITQLKDKLRNMAGVVGADVIGMASMDVLATEHAAEKQRLQAEIEAHRRRAEDYEEFLVLSSKVAKDPSLSQKVMALGNQVAKGRRRLPSVVAELTDMRKLSDMSPLRPRRKPPATGSEYSDSDEEYIDPTAVGAQLNQLSREVRDKDAEIRGLRESSTEETNHVARKLQEAQSRANEWAEHNTQTKQALDVTLAQYNNLHKAYEETKDLAEARRKSVELVIFQRDKFTSERDLLLREAEVAKAKLRQGSGALMEQLQQESEVTEELRQLLAETRKELTVKRVELAASAACNANLNDELAAEREKAEAERGDLEFAAARGRRLSIALETQLKEAKETVNEETREKTQAVSMGWKQREASMVMRARMDKLEGEVEEGRNAAAVTIALRRELSQGIVARDELQFELATVKSDADQVKLALEAQLAVEEEETRAAKAEEGVTQHALEEQSQELSTLTANLEAAQHSISEWHDEFAVLLKERDTLQLAVNTGRDELGAMCMVMEELRCTVEEQAKATRIKEGELADLDSRQQFLVATLTTAQEECKARTSERDELQQAWSTSQDELRTSADAIKELKVWLEEHDGATQVAKKEMEAVRAMLNTKVTELAETTASLALARTDCMETAEHNNELQSGLDQTRDEANVTHAEMQTMIDEEKKAAWIAREESEATNGELTAKHEELHVALEEFKVAQADLQARVEQEQKAVRDAKEESEAAHVELTAKHEEMHVTREEFKVSQADLQARVEQEQDALRVARAESVAVAEARAEEEVQMQRAAAEAAEALRGEHNQIVQRQQEEHSTSLRDANGVHEQNLSDALNEINESHNERIQTLSDNHERTLMAAATEAANAAKEDGEALARAEAIHAAQVAQAKTEHTELEVAVGGEKEAVRVARLESEMKHIELVAKQSELDQAQNEFRGKSQKATAAHAAALSAAHTMHDQRLAAFGSRMREEHDQVLVTQHQEHNDALSNAETALATQVAQAKVAHAELQARIDEEKKAAWIAREESETTYGELTAKHEEMHMTREEFKVAQAGLQARVEQEQEALRVARADAVAVTKARLEEDAATQAAISAAADAMRDAHGETIRSQQEEHREALRETGEKHEQNLSDALNEINESHNQRIQTLSDNHERTLMAAATEAATAAKEDGEALARAEAIHAAQVAQAKAEHIELEVAVGGEKEAVRAARLAAEVKHAELVAKQSELDRARDTFREEHQQAAAAHAAALSMAHAAAQTEMEEAVKRLQDEHGSALSEAGERAANTAEAVAKANVEESAQKQRAVFAAANTLREEHDQVLVTQHQEHNDALSNAETALATQVAQAKVAHAELQARIDEEKKAAWIAREESEATYGELTAKHEEMHMTREEFKVAQAGLQARVEQEQQALRVARAETVAVAKARVKKEQQMQRAAEALRDEHNQIVRTQQEAHSAALQAANESHKTNMLTLNEINEHTLNDIHTEAAGQGKASARAVAGLKAAVAKKRGELEELKKHHAAGLARLTTVLSDTKEEHGKIVVTLEAEMAEQRQLGVERLAAELAAMRLVHGEALEVTKLNLSTKEEAHASEIREWERRRQSLEDAASASMSESKAASQSAHANEVRRLTAIHHAEIAELRETTSVAKLAGEESERRATAAGLAAQERMTQRVVVLEEEHGQRLTNALAASAAEAARTRAEHDAVRREMEESAQAQQAELTDRAASVAAMEARSKAVIDQLRTDVERLQDTAETTDARARMNAAAVYKSHEERCAELAAKAATVETTAEQLAEALASEKEARERASSRYNEEAQQFRKEAATSRETLQVALSKAEAGAERWRAKHEETEKAAVAETSRLAADLAMERANLVNVRAAEEQARVAHAEAVALLNEVQTELQEGEEALEVNEGTLRQVRETLEAKAQQAVTRAESALLSVKSKTAENADLVNELTKSQDELRRERRGREVATEAHQREAAQHSEQRQGWEAESRAQREAAVKSRGHAVDAAELEAAEEARKELDRALQTQAATLKQQYESGTESMAKRLAEAHDVALKRALVDGETGAREAVERANMTAVEATAAAVEEERSMAKAALAREADAGKLAQTAAIEAVRAECALALSAAAKKLQADQIRRLRETVDEHGEVLSRHRNDLEESLAARDQLARSLAQEQAGSAEALEAHDMAMTTLRDVGAQAEAGLKAAARAAIVAHTAEATELRDNVSRLSKARNLATQALEESKRCHEQQVAELQQAHSAAVRVARAEAEATHGKLTARYEDLATVARRTFESKLGAGEEATDAARSETAAKHDELEAHQDELSATLVALAKHREMADSLVAERGALQLTLAARNNELEVANNRLDEQTKAAQAANDEAEELREWMQTTHHELAEATTRLTTSQDRHEETTEHRNVLQSELAQTRDASKVAHAMLQARVENEMVSVQVARAEVEAKHGELEAKRDELEASAETMATARAMCTTLMTQRDDLKAAAHLGKAEAARAVEELRAELRVQAEATQAACTDADSLREWVASSHQELSGTTVNLGEQVEATQAALKEVEALREWLEASHHELSESAARLAATEETCAKTAAERDSLRLELEKAGDESKAVHATLQGMVGEEKEAVRVAKADAEAKQRELAARHEELHLSREESKVAHAELQERVDQGKEAVRLARVEAEVKHGALHEAQESHSALQLAVDERNAELHTTSKAAKELQTRLYEQSEATQAACADAGALRARLESSHQELSGYEAMVAAETQAAKDARSAMAAAESNLRTQGAEVFKVIERNAALHDEHLVLNADLEASHREVAALGEQVEALEAQLKAQAAQLEAQAHEGMRGEELHQQARELLVAKEEELVETERKLDELAAGIAQWVEHDHQQGSGGGE